MPRQKPDPAVVEVLQWLLAQAKAGRMRGLFVVAQLPRGEKYEDWLTGGDRDALAFDVRTSLFRLETYIGPAPAPEFESEPQNS
jgi:hypothetical protein